MKATIPYIEEKFNEFNQAYFGGVLPMLPIRLSDAGRFLGMVTFNQRRDSVTGKMVYSNFVLKINTRADFPEDVVEDTILHEMIHYFIGFQQMEDDAPHGTMFRSIMEMINKKGNRHMTISHKAESREEAEQMVDKKEKYHMICVAKLRDGRVFVKAVPRILPKIIKFNKELPNTLAVVEMDWYLTTDPYFNRFPVSTAIKLYPVDPVELTPYLATSKHCIVTDTKVVEG